MKVPVPVVYVYSGDPVAAGIAESLARPPAGMTGLTFMAAELNGKRLELLQEFVPGLRRVVMIANPEHPGETARACGCAGDGGARRPRGALPADAQLGRAGSGAGQDRRSSGRRRSRSSPTASRCRTADRIIGFAMQQRIPVISGWPVFADSGALCSYGPLLADSYRRLAYYADRVLSGTSPRDLPIEQPTTIEMVVNLKTAAALGLTMPPSVLVRADTPDPVSAAKRGQSGAVQRPRSAPRAGVDALVDDLLLPGVGVGVEGVAHLLLDARRVGVVGLRMVLEPLVGAQRGHHLAAAAGCRTRARCRCTRPAGIPRRRRCHIRPVSSGRGRASRRRSR